MQHPQAARPLYSTGSNVLSVATMARTRYCLAVAGKCIHCNRRLLVSQIGDLIGTASIEHIVPRTHGGTDDLENLALACAACNGEKGVRHDHRSRDDPKLVAMIDRLQRRRRERWREPRPT